MKIVVTGGAGYIGSMLVSDLLDSGHKVTVIDNLIYNQTSISHLIGNKNLEFVFKDIRNVSNIKNYYEYTKIFQKKDDFSFQKASVRDFRIRIQKRFPVLFLCEEHYGFYDHVKVITDLFTLHFWVQKRLKVNRISSFGLINNFL